MISHVVFPATVRGVRVTSVHRVRCTPRDDPRGLYRHRGSSAAPTLGASPALAATVTPKELQRKTGAVKGHLLRRHPRPWPSENPAICAGTYPHGILHTPIGLESSCPPSLKWQPPGHRHGAVSSPSVSALCRPSASGDGVGQMAEAGRR